ncbi:MAG: zinc ABC transporter substrate-binding protein [Planctomycetota bacterium]
MPNTHHHPKHACIWWLQSAAALLLLVPGLTGLAAADQDAERPTVVATVGMLADVAQQIAGDRVEVVGLIAPGIDPHLYRATRADTIQLRQADLILTNGFRLEGKLDEPLGRARDSGTPVIAVAEAILRRAPSETASVTTEESGERDPHVWMDPTLWRIGVDVIRDALTELDPAGQDVFATNADAYSQTLESLIDYAESAIATVPSEARVLVTAHDAFGYFGARFGFEVVGIQGLSTESEAGLRDIERLVSRLVGQRIPAVFVESTVSDRHVRALIAGARSQNHEVRIGGELFSDALGDAGTYEGTYVGMIDHNLTTITRALGGEAPADGFQGRLSDR